MEEGYDSALKFSATRPCYCVWAEGLPDDALADIGGYEEGYPGAQAVAFLQKLIQADDDDTSKKQLQKMFWVSRLSTIGQAEGLVYFLETRKLDDCESLRQSALAREPMMTNHDARWLVNMWDIFWKTWQEVCEAGWL